MVQLVSITLLDTGDGRSILEAIKKDNPGITIMEMPGATKIDREDRLVVNRETVSECMGRDWDPQELHLALISMAGNLDEDDDYFALSWNR
ncbi:MAG: MmoB/DmpM family protein [Magnetospiraceae bacterium]